MPIYQNVAINPYLASPKPITHICLTETTEAIKEEKFYICLTETIYSQKHNQPPLRKDPHLSGENWKGLKYTNLKHFSNTALLPLAIFL